MKNLFLIILTGCLVFSPFFSSAEKGKDKIPFDILIIFTSGDIPTERSVVFTPEIKASFYEDIIDFSINIPVGPVEVSVINEEGRVAFKTTYFTTGNDIYSFNLNSLEKGKYILQFYLSDYHKFYYQGSFTK